jgi:excisionase family DNA binding protein
MKSENAASTRDGETLSISEAAAALGVSERTVRRRCERSELAAQMATGESGGRVWRVDRAAISERAAKSSDRADSVRTDGRADVRPHSESESGVRPKRADSVRPQMTARPNDRADSEARVLAAENEMLRDALQREREATARERETGDQWRAQVEAANRDAAEMRAALREALRAMPKAIEAREYSQRDGAKLEQVGTGNAGAQNDAEAAKSATAAKVTGAAKTGGKREPRALWKVILGLR